MTLAQQMIVISPADGPAPLSAEQRELLVGKARWTRTVFDAGFPTIPTICLTRAAWDALQTERDQPVDRLRTAWVTTLFRLVKKGEAPPMLVVRTSAIRHRVGLMSVRKEITPPTNEVDSVALRKPLGNAIQAAFASYDKSEPVWAEPQSENARNNQIVVIQATALGDLSLFMTRDAQNGFIGPAPIPGQKGLGSIKTSDEVLQLCELLDSASGRHMVACVATKNAHVQFVSARPTPVNAEADLAAAVDRAEKGIWSTHQAVKSFDPARLPYILHPRLQADENRVAIATGLGVSPGAASGKIVFDPEDAVRMNARGIHCILVMMETGPIDVEGMQAATGALTARGGMTSHAAMVASVTGRPCVAGVRSLHVDLEELTCEIGGKNFAQGDQITIDGSSGEVFVDAQPLSMPHVRGAVSRLLDWSDGTRSIAVRTNVETVAGAKTAIGFGAEGIGPGSF